MRIDSAVVDATAAEMESRGIDDIIEVIRGLNEDMSHVFENAGPNFDLSLVPDFRDLTNTERVDRLGRVHSRLAGTRQALRQKRELATAAEQARNALIVADPREITGGLPPEQPGEVAGPSIGARIIAAIKQRAQEGQRSAPISMTVGIDQARVRRQFANGWVGGPRLFSNDLFERSDGFPPESVRTGRIAYQQLPRLEAFDLLHKDTTDQEKVVYMSEDEFTAYGRPRAEGLAAVEADLSLTEKDVAVQAVSVLLNVTREQLRDERRAQAYLDRRLPYLVNRVLQHQAYKGDGAAPELQGLLALPTTTTGEAGKVHTLAHSTGSVLNTFRSMITTVETDTEWMPNAWVVHPEAWEQVQLLRAGTGGTYGVYQAAALGAGNVPPNIVPSDVGDERGAFLFGDPATGMGNMLFGIPVVRSTVNRGGPTDSTNVFAAPTTAQKNVVLLGAWNMETNELAMRDTMEIETTNAHSDYFAKWIYTVRCELRAAMVWPQPHAFCTGTALGLVT